MIFRIIAHRCRTWIKRGKIARRTFCYSQYLLMKGLYYNPCETNELRKIDRSFFSLKNILFSHLFYNRTDGKGMNIFGIMDLAQNRLSFNHGMGKIVLFTKEYAYGFYEIPQLYQRAKNNFDNNYDLFNYPCVPILGFNDDKELIVMKNLKGRFFADCIHDEIIVQGLLHYNLDSAVKENEYKEVFFLQHGDAKYDNIIWNKDSFMFIDLDGIQFLPPLFDFFYYLNSRGYSLKDIERFIEKYNALANRIYKKANILDNSNPLDILLYRYVLQFKKWGGYFENFSFLTHSRLSDYPITGKLLKDMQISLSQDERPEVEA